MNNRKTYIIPFFIPFNGCPHKCIYCNQNLITGFSSKRPSREKMFTYFDNYLSFSKKTHKNVEIAFFGGTFLGMDNQKIIYFLESAKKFASFHPDINFEIRFSTRPDTITDTSIDLLKNYPISTIELGIQSMDDYVLKKSGRGHTAEDSRKACHLIRTKRPDINLGLQFMPGLPGETNDSINKIFDFLNEIIPDYLRIYPTVVLKDTALETLFNKNQFTPLSLEKAVEISSRIYDLSAELGIKVIRMGLPSEVSKENIIVSGPWHPSFGELVMQKSIYQKIKNYLEKIDDLKDKTVSFSINPSSESLFRGWKNSTVKNIKQKFAVCDIKFQKDKSMAKDDFLINVI